MSDISDIASPKISTWPSLIKIFRTIIVMKRVSGKFQSWLKACLLHYYHLTVPLAHVRNLEWPQGLSDMLAHVRDLNPLPFINQPWLMCRKCLISTKQILLTSHLVVVHSTQKKCPQWWTVWSASSGLFNSQNMSVILLNTWMLKYKSLLRDITNITWSCLVLEPNGGMEVKLVNIPVVNVLVLPGGRLPLTSFLLAGLCGIIQRRCLGSTSLLCSCAIGENHCKLCLSNLSTICFSIERKLSRPRRRPESGPWNLIVLLLSLHMFFRTPSHESKPHEYKTRTSLLKKSSIPTSSSCIISIIINLM